MEVASSRRELAARHFESRVVLNNVIKAKISITTS